MSPRPSAVSPFDNLSTDFLNPYQPAPVPSFLSAPVPPFPIFSAPPVTMNTSLSFSPLPAHESMQFSNSGVSRSSPSSIFGRKALTPPALPHFAPDTFRTWLVRSVNKSSQVSAKHPGRNEEVQEESKPCVRKWTTVKNGRHQNLKTA
jgi:hypothetical protein